MEVLWHASSAAKRGQKLKARQVLVALPSLLRFPYPFIRLGVNYHLQGPNVPTHTASPLFFLPEAILDLLLKLTTLRDEYADPSMLTVAGTAFLVADKDGVPLCQTTEDLPPG